MALNVNIIGMDSEGNLQALKVNSEGNLDFGQLETEIQLIKDNQGRLYGKHGEAWIPVKVDSEGRPIIAAGTEPWLVQLSGTIPSLVEVDGVQREVRWAVDADGKAVLTFENVGDTPTDALDKLSRINTAINKVDANTKDISDRLEDTVKPGEILYFFESAELRTAGTHESPILNLSRYKELRFIFTSNLKTGENFTAGTLRLRYNRTSVFSWNGDDFGIVNVPLQATTALIDLKDYAGGHFKAPLRSVDMLLTLSSTPDSGSFTCYVLGVPN